LRHAALLTVFVYAELADDSTSGQGAGEIVPVQLASV
jgi:hypothetical protein